MSVNLEDYKYNKYQVARFYISKWMASKVQIKMKRLYTKKKEIES